VDRLRHPGRVCGARPPAGSPTFLTAARREADLDALARNLTVDVLVVGGGVTGTGAALDAASRGLSVALLERRDLATGTSRWSSKLVHGGLLPGSGALRPGLGVGPRARDAGQGHRPPSRARPALPDPGARPDVASPALAMEAGVRVGDAMRALADTSRRRRPGMRRVSAAEGALWAPALSAQRLHGGLLHWDGQLEDDARLVVALARTAAAHGARIVTHAEALQLHGDGARVTRAAARPSTCAPAT